MWQNSYVLNFDRPASSDFKGHARTAIYSNVSGTGEKKMYVCMHACMYVCMYVWMYVRM